MGQTKKQTRRGLSLIELIVLIGIIGLIGVMGVVLIGNERAKTRDSQRIADMARVQAAFQILFVERASYAEAAQGCPAVGDEVSQCGLGRYLTGLGNLRDPGKFSYLVSQVPDENGYEISFTLERAYGSLAVGKHKLTAAGIR